MRQRARCAAVWGLWCGAILGSGWGTLQAPLRWVLRSACQCRPHLRLTFSATFTATPSATEVRAALLP